MGQGSKIPHLLTEYLAKKALTISFVILALSIVIASAIIALPRSHAVHATGMTGAAITVSPLGSPYSNRDDQPPIVVQGTGYAVGESVNVYWNYTGPGTGKLEGTATTNAHGVFSLEFLRELAPYGAYTIGAVGQTSGFVATTTYKQFPQLYVRAQAGGPNSPITIYGNAYGVGESVKIYWNYTGPGTGTLIATATGNSTGSFTVNATIPSGYVPGTYAIEGIGHTTKGKSKYNYIIYQPTLELAPFSGSAGISLTVSAYGFTGGEDVDIFWDSDSTPLTTVPTSGYGYVAPVIITVPTNATPGNHTVKVVGKSSSLTIKNTYTVVAPGSNLSIGSGPVGAKVQVSGQGYAPNETVHIVWNYTGPGTGTNVANLTAGYGGTIRGKFTVPQASNGSYMVAAVGASSNSTTQNAFSISNSLATNPTGNSPGQGITATGTGFQANEAVQLFWDGTSGTLLNTTSADANGNINQAINIPNNATPGNHTVAAVGQTSGQSFNTAVNVDTSWSDFGFDAAHHRENIYEHSIGTGNAANLKLKWAATTLISLKDSPVYANGLVYICTMDGFLNAYNATTGVQAWSFNSKSTFRNFSSPVVDPATGMIYFGTVGYADEGIPSPFYALDGQTGTLQWSVVLDWHTVSFPTIAFNTIYLGTSHLDHANSSLFALDTVSGHVRWQYHSDSGIWGAVGVDTNTNTVFTGIGNPSAGVVALNASTGATIWNQPIAQYGADDDVGSAITVDNGHVYASSKNGNVYKLNESNGAILWATAIGPKSIGTISSQAVTANGMLYVGGINGYLYALNANTGAIAWHIHAGSNIFSSPAVANGVIYFASFDKNIYAVNSSNGTVLWKYTTGNISYSSPIFVNGWLYCGSTDGKLYAFSL